MMPDEKFYESMATVLLNYFGNNKPKREQVSYFGSIISNVWLRRMFSFNNGLSEREKACLYYALQGKNSSEVAKLLDTNINAVKICKSETLQKLLYRNVAQAVSIGIEYGAIFIL